MVVNVALMEGAVNNTQVTCMCGEEMHLSHVLKMGRHGDKLVSVLHVPVHVCEECDMKIMSGPDSLRFAERVEYAAERKMSEITF